MSARLRAAVIGVGYLGNFHVQKYRSLDTVEVVGVADTDLDRATEVGDKYGVPAYADYRALLGQVDLVSIVTPPATHYEITLACLESGAHVLVEKPVTATVAEAEHLIAVASMRERAFQVGHLERFNPATIALRKLLDRPLRIEAQRHARYKKRGTEVDVVLDMMIHDIDIVLSLLDDSPLVDIAASGTTVVTGDTDIAHARLTFANGCVAELSASRVSKEQVRTMNVHQAESYVSIDYSNHAVLVGTVDRGGRKDESREVTFETRALTRTDVLMDEIRSFVQAVIHGGEPTVSGEDGRRALACAVEISQRIEHYRRRCAARGSEAF